MRQDPSPRRNLTETLIAISILAMILYIARPLVVAAIFWWTS